MDIYDLMYSKDALNIYIYLFSNRNLNKEKEMKIKDILYVVYMYTFYYEKTQSVQKLFELFQKIHYIEDVDNLLSEDTYLSKFYQLIKIHEDILQENIKNEYQLVFTNVRYTVGLVGTSIGLYFAGIMYNYGIAFNLGLSAFFVLFQLALTYYLVYLRRKESKEI